MLTYCILNASFKYLNVYLFILNAYLQYFKIYKRPTQLDMVIDRLSQEFAKTQSIDE